MNNLNVNLVGHGFVPVPITLDQHIFGVQRIGDPIQHNGDWRQYLPTEERQARLFFDTFGCTIYNTVKPIQILERKLFGEQSDYSERFVYIGTETMPPGNNPHIIAEWIRKNGLIPEARLPFTDELQSLDQYASPKPLLSNHIEEGRRWIAQKDFLHDWVFSGGTPKEKNDALKEAIRRAPLAVSVVGWKEYNGIYVKDEGEPDNHWSCLVAFEGDSPIIFDSYAPFIKKLAPLYDFGFAKRYTVFKKPKSIIPIKKSFWQKVNDAFTHRSSDGICPKCT